MTLPLYLKAQYYYIISIFLPFRVYSVFALLVCLQETVKSLGTGTMSYPSLCLPASSTVPGT